MNAPPNPNILHRRVRPRWNLSRRLKNRQEIHPVIINHIMQNGKVEEDNREANMQMDCVWRRNFRLPYRQHFKPFAHRITGCVMPGLPLTYDSIFNATLADYIAIDAFYELGWDFANLTHHDCVDKYCSKLGILPFYRSTGHYRY